MLYSKRDTVLAQEERGSDISEEVKPTASGIFLIFLNLIARNMRIDFKQRSHIAGCVSTGTLQ